MNVTELARKLKITKEQLFTETSKLGFDIGRRAIKVDDKVAKKILKALEGKIKLLKTDQPEEEKIEYKVEKGSKISLPEQITARELAEKLNMPVVDLISLLMKNGIMSSQNEEIDYETAAIITEDLGYQPSLEKKETTIHEELQESNLTELLKDDSSRLKPKPPVVVVLGHVDHGKTALLDAIRKTNVIGSESGGITQHIGAYQVTHKGSKITFVDTPGHEAFSKMRGRGAKVADIAILVIAADDGLKPQTEEAISIIKTSKLPYLVAINKVDKPDADVQKVKQQLTQKDMNPEEWGGKVICQEVSAIKKTGIKELLDMILLIADVEKEKLLANPKREAVGYVVESHVDKGEGPVATVLINTGTLRQGDLVSVGDVAGKIKALKDHKGQNIKEAVPAQPVRIIGLKGSPQVGDILQVIEDQKILKKKLKEQQIEKVRVIRQQATGATDQDNNKKSKIKCLNIVLKTDNLGSQEAIINSLRKLRNEEVMVNIVKKGLGNISGQDVVQADTADAYLYGFQVVETNESQEVIRNRNYNRLKIFEIIYELIDEVKKHLENMLDPEVIREDMGKAAVLAVFRQDNKGTIIGVKVNKGKIKPNTRFSITRQKEIIVQGDIVQVQIEKRVVPEVIQGMECGLKLKGSVSLEEGDKIDIFEEHKRPRKLAI